LVFVEGPRTAAEGTLERLEREAPARAASSAVDRRLHPRYALTLAVTLRGDNNFYTGLSGNISGGGIFIATQHVLPIGTPVVMSLSLMHSTSITIRGTVRWVRAPEATANPFSVFSGDVHGVVPGMGIQFEDLDAEAAA
jgi:uncharacterized protein (TIGR02266 family)